MLIIIGLFPQKRLNFQLTPLVSKENTDFTFFQLQCNFVNDQLMSFTKVSTDFWNILKGWTLVYIMLYSYIFFTIALYVIFSIFSCTWDLIKKYFSLCSLCWYLVFNQYKYVSGFLNVYLLYLFAGKAFCLYELLF